jgi:hypothetical protein
MDSQYKGMMTHPDGRFDALQTHMIGHYFALTTRMDVVDTQFDSLHHEFGEFRDHIRENVQDPLMSRMNNMQ